MPDRLTLSHRLIVPLVLAAVTGLSPVAPASAARPAAPPDTVEVDLSSLFGDLDGTFVLVRLADGHTRVYNPERAAERFLPASTYKIPHALIALDARVADGPDSVIPWDSIAAPPADWWPRPWRRDQTLRSAFRNSVFWAFQAIAREVGPERMQRYVSQFGYGNEDLGGGIDQFWLRGDLRISPYEQTAFLERLRDGALGVSEQARAHVLDFMLLDEGPGYRLLGKTGTAELTATRELGWLVGFLERDDAVYAYALNMEGERVWEDWPPQQRRHLVRQLLMALEALPPAGE